MQSWYNWRVHKAIYNYKDCLCLANNILFSSLLHRSAFLRSVSSQETEQTGIEMKRRFYTLIIMFLFGVCTMNGQRVSLHTNLLYWGTATPNIGLEMKLGAKTTLQLWGACNAWKFPNEMKLNLQLVQPEARYWFCQAFEAGFIGVHAHAGRFNVGQIPFIPDLKDRVYRGEILGGGVSYGYHWALDVHWGMEATIGAGYAYTRYKKYRCAGCAELEGDFTRHYLGPTRVGVSIIYFIR